MILINQSNKVLLTVTYSSDIMNCAGKNELMMVCKNSTSKVISCWIWAISTLHHSILYTLQRGAHTLTVAHFASDYAETTLHSIYFALVHGLWWKWVQYLRATLAKSLLSWYSEWARPVKIYDHIKMLGLCDYGSLVNESKNMLCLRRNWRISCSQ